MRVEHQFVEHIPEDLEEGILYITIPFATVLHLCACGCGSEVATPLSPTDWSITFNGESVSLSPSVGSWILPCRSHYWIRENRVRWAGDWSDEQIEGGRARDRAAKRAYFDESETREGDVAEPERELSRRLWGRVKAWFRRLRS